MKTDVVLSWLASTTLIFMIFSVYSYKKEKTNLINGITKSTAFYIKEKVPINKTRDLKKQLTYAGNPLNLNPYTFLATQLILGISILIIGLNMKILINLPLIITILISIMVSFIPLLILKKKIKTRQNKIDKQVPELVGLLTTAVSAGVDLNKSLEVIGNFFPDCLGDELRLTWKQIATGMPRNKALQNMANRTGVDSVKRLVDTINTASERGSMNVSKVLSEFQYTIKEMRRKKLQEKAKKIPNKMNLPIFICIFAPMLILLLVPLAIVLTEQM